MSALGGGAGRVRVPAPSLLVTALDSVRRETAGRGYDGVLLVPAFLEAGRLTAGDIHWARVGGRLVPVGKTEFAHDATSGYCRG